MYIVIPETSGFYGRLEERTAGEQEMFFHLQMHSLTRGQHSLKAKLDEYNLKINEQNLQNEMRRQDGQENIKANDN